MLSDCTFTWSDIALNPKSEILMFPAISSNRFSSWHTRSISVSISYYFFGQIISDDTYKAQNQGAILHLQVSVVYTPTMTIIYCIYQLLKVSACFVLLQSSTCGLIVSSDNKLPNCRAKKNNYSAT